MKPGRLLEPRETSSSNDPMGRVVERARGDRDDRRCEPRHPFFFPAIIRFQDGQELPAYVRDISDTGIGLVHTQDPLQVNDVVAVNLELEDSELEDSERVSLRVQIRWCRRGDPAWYASGGKITGGNCRLPSRRRT